MKLITTAALLCIVIVMLASCGSSDDYTPPVVDTVQVDVPVYQFPEAPKELFRVPVSPTSIPEFVAPTDQRCVVGLTQAGAEHLKVLMLRDESLLDGWENFGSK